MKSVIDSLGLGLQEFLAILLPGLLMCYFLTCTPLIEYEALFVEADWMSGPILFGCSYFIGYVIYVVGSFLDKWYDRIKLKALGLKNSDWRLDEHLDYVEPTKKLNIIYSVLFPYLTDTHNLTVKVVASLKNKDVGFDFDGKSYNLMNAYQYAFRRLMADAPLLFDEVQRYYVTAKFFRSMTVVLFLGTFIWLAYGSDKVHPVWIITSCIISFFVFLNRWRMANHVAYKNLIVLEEVKSLDSKK